MFLLKILIFLYCDTLHRENVHFCRYCLQSFSTEEILKRHNSKQRIIMPKKGK